MIFTNSKGQRFQKHKNAGCFQVTSDPQTWEDEDDEDDEDDENCTEKADADFYERHSDI